MEQAVAEMAVNLARNDPLTSLRCDNVSLSFQPNACNLVLGHVHLYPEASKSLRGRMEKYASIAG